MAVVSEQRESVPFSLLLPDELRRQLQAAAVLHGRSSGGELRQALKLYLRGLGVADGSKSFAPTEVPVRTKGFGPDD